MLTASTTLLRGSGLIIAPYGKGNVAWFVLAALLAIVVLAQISRWYSAQHRMNKGKPKATIINPLPRNKVVLAVSILLKPPSSAGWRRVKSA
ncbi:hypothetical protein ACUOFC_31450 [Escherichia sp. TWPC-MK]